MAVAPGIQGQRSYDPGWQCPPVGSPTAMPKDNPYPLEMRNLMDLIAQGSDVDGIALIDALDTMRRLHEVDVQWIEWPNELAAVRQNKYYKPGITLLRGLGTLVTNGAPAVSQTATNFLNELCCGQSVVSEVPPELMVEAGVIPALVDACIKRSCEMAANTIWFISRDTEDETAIAMLVDGGAIEGSLAIIQDNDATPGAQIQALSILDRVAAFMPERVAQAGVWEVLQGYKTRYWMTKRRKVMDKLRPLVDPEQIENGTWTPLVTES